MYLVQKINMLIALTDKKEIQKANDLLFSKLSSLKHEDYTIRYSSADGKEPKIKVSYSTEFEFWWGNSKDQDDNRFWNPFGIKKPRENSLVAGSCQMNYSSEGINKNVGGLLAKDAKGKFYLLHSGNVGGGQRGVGKNAFKDYYTGNSISVQVGVEEAEYFVVTHFDSARFHLNILDFVNTVYNFKAHVKTLKANKKPLKPKNPLKDGEYLGIKTYDLPDKTITASNHHAVITNQLISDLRGKKFKVERDQFRDAYTVNDKGIIDRVFEVKSSLSRQCLYTAIGQLALHSLIYDSKKYFVIDQNISPQLIIDLKKIGIQCITYKWKANKKSVQFHGLKSL